MIRPDRVIALRGSQTVFQYKDLCAKVYSRTHSCADVLREVGNLAAAWEGGASVPELIEVRQQNGRWMMVTEYIPGETLAQRIGSGKDRLSSCLRILVQAQRHLQKVPPDRFPSLTESLRREIAQTSLDPSIRSKLLSRLDGPEEGSCLCHRNLSPDNLLLPAGRKPVAVDWSQACRGSADADAAAVWILLETEYGQDAAQLYLDLYCGLSGRQERDILRWVPVMAASRIPGSVQRERERLKDLIRQSLKGWDEYGD